MSLFQFIHHAPSQRRRAVRLLANMLLLAGLGAGLSACNTVPQQAAPAVVPANPVAKTLKPVRIGLALGGGAARGFAHIGVIKALESQGISPDVVVGTSAGSVVGAMYAAGNNGFALQKMALEMDEATISDWSLPLFSKSSGVLKGDALQTYVNRLVAQAPIEKLRKPFGAVATDLATGHPVLFQRGNTGAAVRASSAVPGVFQPVKINDRLYVDGGLVSPVPVRFARDMGADIVIAVNISSPPEPTVNNATLDILLQTVAIMGQSINQFELKQAEIVIRPELPGMKGNDFAGRNLAILAGEKAAMAMMPEIKQKIKAMQER
ncbi:patatin-like phospholipase family protein [Undibacterium sp. TS12]|uniref:patatin-like phospholipase family protein n=1 Tax=Undibacterium sp. TS12 TaxID=2908202 RepID=UPI001F4C8B2B|nr:patatin-like phospholipase family protein [Undibacterium sp. TS12]MCH8620602.1 patatin-like phospholipase family protein [Undibacterium sp. TS12]